MMDFSKFSRAEYENAAKDPNALAAFLSALEKALIREWNETASAVTEKIVAGLNAQGHDLKRLEDHILAFADVRPEGQPSFLLDVFSTCSVSAKAEKPEIREVAADAVWYEKQSDSTFGKYLAHGYESLAPEERMFHDVDQLDREVNNGGFEQYFTNSAGANAHEALAALKRIGAKKTAKLLAEAIAVFENASVPKEDEARIKAAEKALLLHPGAWGKLDRRYYKSADNLLGLLYSALGPGSNGNTL